MSVSPSERIATAETGEAAEVGVVGVDLCLILHRQRGDMCVRHEVRADAGGVEIPPEIGQVVGTGVDWDDWGKRNHSRT